jgi:hypothetical protein
MFKVSKSEARKSSGVSARKKNKRKEILLSSHILLIFERNEGG